MVETATDSQFTIDQVSDLTLQVKSMIYAHMTTLPQPQWESNETNNVVNLNCTSDSPILASDQAMVFIEMIEPFLDSLLSKYVGKLVKDSQELLVQDLFEIFDQVFGWNQDLDEPNEDVMSIPLANEEDVMDQEDVEWKVVRNSM